MVISNKHTTFAPANTGVAQLVEHRSPKPGVGSSSLSSRAKIISCKSTICSLFCLYRTKLGLMKYILIILGSISLALGVIGIFLPLLPTTPFLLLSATLYVRSSEKLYHWLINQKHLGTYIRNFREYKAIPLRAKIISVTLVWITLLYCAISISESIYLSILLLLLATAISWHILSYKTLK